MRKGLFHQLQLIDNIAGATELVDAPEYITHIHTDGAVEVFIKSNFMTEGFVVAIEGQANQVTTAVDYRASAVTTGDIIGGDKGYHQVVAGFINVLPEIFLLK